MDSSIDMIYVYIAFRWSMGAGQTYQWALSYPKMVERILPFCGSAKTSPHNMVRKASHPAIRALIPRCEV